LDIYAQIEKRLREFLLQYQFTIDEMGASPRSIGDKVQEVITNNFSNICKGIAKGLNMQFKGRDELSRRAFADAAFLMGDKYLAFGVKTRNIEAGFHMPNIKAVERLARFYTSDTNTLVVISADYQLNLKDETKPIIFHKVTVAPIEQISWRCLRFGKLGYGLVQVEPNQPIIVDRKQSREEWMRIFFNKLRLFYEDELEKSEAMVEWAKDCEELCDKGQIHKLPKLRSYIRRKQIR
jgi:hypothetical protein